MNSVQQQTVPENAAWLEFEKCDATTWAQRPLTSHFPDALAHFLLLQASPHTRKAYARDLLEFLSDLENLGTVLKTVSCITEKHILLWKENLSARHSKFQDSRRRVANASVARKLSTLSSFLEFALKRKLITENPIRLVKRPPVRRQSHATVLTEAELTTLLDFARTQLSACTQGPQLSEREKADALSKAQTEWCILVLLFTVGMRVSELCQLRLADVVQEGDLVRLHLLAKGGRQHSPLLHPESAHVLLNYIQQRRAGCSPQSPLFPAGRASPHMSGEVAIHRSTVFRMVRDAAKRAGIERAFSPHGCRATLATQLHLNEVPVVEIQGLLNHAQVTTTQLYLHRVHELKESAALSLPWTEHARLKISPRGGE